MGISNGKWPVTTNKADFNLALYPVCPWPLYCEWKSSMVNKIEALICPHPLVAWENGACRIDSQWCSALLVRRKLVPIFSGVQMATTSVNTPAAAPLSILLTANRSGAHCHVNPSCKPGNPVVDLTDCTQNNTPCRRHYWSHSNRVRALPLICPLLWTQLYGLIR